MNELTAPEDRQQFDLSPRNFEQALTFSNYLSDSDLVPKDYKGKPANCLIAMQWGAEVGLKPLQAIQNIAVINGRPSMWGDAVLALVRASPLCESVVETESDTQGTCTVKRRGEPEYTVVFTVDDAKKAGLHGKQGPWQQSPKRMMKLRARAFALRDKFTDVLRGIAIAEESLDLAPEPARVVHMGVVDQVAPPAAAPAPAAPTLPPYSQAAFEKNLPSWNALIRSGKKSADQIVASLMTKASLSEQQLEGIYALASRAADSEGDELAEHAEAAAPAQQLNPNDPPF